MATKVLVVDDERNLVDLLRGYLEREGYTVLATYDGRTALDLARMAQPDVVLLDLMLPEVDGLEVCRRLRQFSDAYVLMLTAKTEEVDKLVGLSLGADDYVTKPFSPREVVARVKTLLRRPRGSTAAPDMPPAPRIVGDLVVDEAQRDVSVRGASVTLTVREFDLLLMLASHPAQVFTRTPLLERVWGAASYDAHVVDVHVANLRKKIEDDPGQARYIETVRGVGYRLCRKAG